MICLSTNGAIPLKQFIGSQVAIDIVNDQSELNRISGIVTKADMGASDGSLTIYRLTVEDPTALWKHRRNSRVFMAKSAVEVIQTVFQEWVRRSSLFASSLTLDMSGLTKDYDVRPFIMQASESDFNFLIRLMKSENISYLIDEAKLKVSSSSEQIQPQKLRLIDDNSQYTRLERQNIRFHRSSAVEHRDSIISLVAERSLQPTSVHIHRWQADAHEIEEGAGHVQSKHQHSENYDNASLGLEQVWHFSPAWIQDLNGEDGVTQSGNSQIEKFNENLSHYYDSQAKQFTATSTVRDAHVGQFFELDEHPVISQLETSDKQFLIVSKQFYNQNNLPKDLTEHWDKNPIDVVIEHGANSITLHHVIGMQTSVAHSNELITGHDIFAGLSNDDTMSHDQARSTMLAIFKDLKQAGWQRYISLSGPRLIGKDAWDYAKKDLYIYALDPDYVYSLDEWMQLGNGASWMLQANGIYLTITLRRDQTKMDPQQPGAYYVSYKFQSEKEYYAPYFKDDDLKKWEINAARWVSLYPGIKKQMNQIRAKTEAELKAQGITIDESYKDPALVSKN